MKSSPAIPGGWSTSELALLSTNPCLATLVFRLPHRIEETFDGIAAC